MLKEKEQGKFSPHPLPDAPAPAPSPELPAPEVKARPRGKVIPAGDPTASVEPIAIDNPGFMARKVPIATTCAQCGSRTTRDPGALPFSSGPFKGGFFCRECWTLYWDEHPELLGDAKSRAMVAEEARRIRLKRAGDGSKLLFEEAGNRAFLTPRGTVIIDVKRLPFGGPDEFDEGRLLVLGRLLEAVKARVESTSDVQQAG